MAGRHKQPIKLMASEWTSSPNELKFTVGVKLQNFNNSRQHWAVRAGSSGSQKIKAYAVFARCHGAWAKWAAIAQNGDIVRIHMVRYGPGRMDSDGPVSALKYIRDAVSHYLGVDDGQPNLVWTVDSVVNPEHGCTISITAG